MRRLHVKGFSLIELLIVTVIIALIAAIALPRLSRGASGASDAALVNDVELLRKAVELYAAEHGGTYPTVANFRKQLTKYTDVDGNMSNQSIPPFIYGPYLSDIPSLPVGNGGTKVGAAAAPGVAWIYDANSGTILVNTTTEADATGRLYNTY
jgi:general secretion pathway protein G